MTVPCIQGQQQGLGTNIFEKYGGKIVAHQPMRSKSGETGGANGTKLVRVVPPPSEDTNLHEQGPQQMLCAPVCNSIHCLCCGPRYIAYVVGVVVVSVSIVTAVVVIDVVAKIC
ncbi:hypothetical protein Aduo_010161 [Ancylostoma duodenale]